MLFEFKCAKAGAEMVQSFDENYTLLWKVWDLSKVFFYVCLTVEYVKRQVICEIAPCAQMRLYTDFHNT
jgi:hypothetical protein